MDLKLQEQKIFDAVKSAKYLLQSTEEDLHNRIAASELGNRYELQMARAKVR
ncbi:MAG: hypothetical protein WKF71_19205 [Pyrinomonadaceae bacterium]